MPVTSILIFAIGTIFGAIIAFAINNILRKKSDEELARNKDEIEKISKAAFYEVASQSTDQLIKLAKQTLDAKTSESSAELDGKKQLIDQSLTALSKDMQERLEKVQKLMSEIGQAVPEKYGQVSNAISNIATQSENLRKTTDLLRIALSGSQQRGQWGERIAEDILRHVGLVEGISYIKQRQIEGGRSRPDFTFILPENLKVNMDVKFPTNRYLEYLQANDDTQRENTKKIFLSSVRARIKEVTTRDYINPDDNTVDYVLVFIPNEQVYSFIHECDLTILDDALKQKVVLCSPLTLYAMLALIRQAIDNFNLRKSSTEIQALLAGFSQQWGKFIACMTSMGEKIDSAKDEFDKLTGTRKKMLDSQIKKIDQLNKAGSILPKIEDNGDSIEIEPQQNQTKNIKGDPFL
ncbi:MAG TPA: DNA recombination protein RmuC [candidate division Zixibacteria bacterium]|nr:DNA recombination protein RmuC [candidate division Zixibacteria bacterium]